jgi:hypothetical protein
MRSADCRNRRNGRETPRIARNREKPRRNDGNLPVVIDGNNLLFAAREIEAAGPPVTRAMLCKRVGLWAERHKIHVRIVFDGAKPPAPTARLISHRAVQVSFSGIARTADEVIIKYLSDYSAARRLRVVSSDHAIARAARRRRAKSIESDKFWRRIRRELVVRFMEEQEPIEKKEGLRPDARAVWLREFGIDDPPEDDTLERLR